MTFGGGGVGGFVKCRSLDLGRTFTPFTSPSASPQDVHVMVIFGLGFLYTFLERLTHCGSGYTLLIAVLCAQVHILVNGWLHWNAPINYCEKTGSNNVIVVFHWPFCVRLSAPPVSPLKNGNKLHKIYCR